MKHRCVNLDWLEVFCEEDPQFPFSVERMQRLGWEVERRAYGTPMYQEMYTLFRGGVPVLEVRRNPYSKKSEGGLFADGACHVRYSNRTCYGVSPMQEMRNFIERAKLHYRSISRVDICMDFLKFEDAQEMSPRSFIINYMNGHLLKIGQNKIRGVSEGAAITEVEGCSFAGRICGIGNRINSLRWGGKKCPISTKLYNKSLEMREVKRKDYIIDQWVAAGMVTREYVTERDGKKRLALMHDGKEVDVWRLEYSIKLGGSTFVETQQGEIIDFSLSSIDTRDKMLSVFCALTNRYFDIRYSRKTKSGKAENTARLKTLKVIVSKLMERAYKPMQLSMKKDLDRFKRIIIKKLSSMVESDVADEQDRSAFRRLMSFISKFYNVRDLSPVMNGKIDPFPFSIDTLTRSIPLLTIEAKTALLDKINLLEWYLFENMKRKHVPLLPIVDDGVPF